MKQKQSPRTANTIEKICELRRDNISTKSAWISISENEVSIYRQKSGERATGQVTISRKAFEKFIDWYNAKQ